MKQNSGLEPIAVPEATGDLLNALNAGVLGFQHAVVCLKPYCIQDTPEIASDHISYCYHLL